MDIERPPNLRTPGTEPGSATPPGGARLGGTPPINALAELVADLIAATGLVPADKLAVVRGAAGQGSLAKALVDGNVASSESSPSPTPSARGRSTSPSLTPATFRPSTSYVSRRATRSRSGLRRGTTS